MNQHIENYCRRTALLLRLLEGDLADEITEAAKDEIRRCLHCQEVEIDVPPVVMVRDGE